MSFELDHTQTLEKLSQKLPWLRVTTCEEIGKTVVEWYRETNRVLPIIGDVRNEPHYKHLFDIRDLMVKWCPKLGFSAEEQEVCVISALLHDAMEVRNFTWEDVACLAGDGVANNVGSLSRDYRLGLEDRWSVFVGDVWEMPDMAKLVLLADVASDTILLNKLGRYGTKSAALKDGAVILLNLYQTIACEISRVYTDQGNNCCDAISDTLAQWEKISAKEVVA